MHPPSHLARNHWPAPASLVSGCMTILEVDGGVTGVSGVACLGVAESSLARSAAVLEKRPVEASFGSKHGKALRPLVSGNAKDKAS